MVNRRSFFAAVASLPLLRLLPWPEVVEPKAVEPLGYDPAGPMMEWKNYTFQYREPASNEQFMEILREAERRLTYRPTND